jgi:tetratricopeptide (TPR) repeat protein
MKVDERERGLRKLDEVEGYLLLDMPAKALELLESRPEWPGCQFEASLLQGETFRALGRYREALGPLQVAANLRPGHLGVAIALGWCFKRTNRLAQAIDALEQALRENPDESILHYNLACYWSLAGNADRAIRELGQAVDLDPDYLAQLESETDFDPIRTHPDFHRFQNGGPQAEEQGSSSATS